MYVIPVSMKKLNQNPQLTYYKFQQPIILPNKQEDIIGYAYRDFNVSFGERLNRTPENFYEQPFNRKNMPKLMKEYLFRDYEDRQKMPPYQMLRTVYADLKDIESLDLVPHDEPLFQNLTNEPNRTARKGLVFEVQELKSEMGHTPLFKDGSSNLGMYLLRKI